MDKIWLDTSPKSVSEFLISIRGEDPVLLIIKEMQARVFMFIILLHSMLAHSWAFRTWFASHPTAKSTWTASRLVWALQAAEPTDARGAVPFPKPPALSVSFHTGPDRHLAADLRIPPCGVLFLCSSIFSYMLPANSIQSASPLGVLVSWTQQWLSSMWVLLLLLYSQETPSRQPPWMIIGIITSFLPEPQFWNACCRMAENWNVFCLVSLDKTGL